MGRIGPMGQIGQGAEGELTTRDFRAARTCVLLPYHVLRDLGFRDLRTQRTGRTRRTMSRDPMSWCEKQRIALPGNTPSVIFNALFLPRFVRPVRQVGPVRQPRQNCPRPLPRCVIPGGAGPPHIRPVHGRCRQRAAARAEAGPETPAGISERPADGSASHTAAGSAAGSPAIRARA